MIDQSTPIDQVEFAGIDFESAGAGSGKTDMPIQIGIAVLNKSRTIFPNSLHQFIAPTSPIVWRAGDAVHGLTAADLEGAPSMNDLWPTVRGLLKNRVCVAHGAGTERKFLRAYPMHGFGPWLDTLSLARKTLPDLEDHRLGTCAGALGLVDEIGDFCETDKQQRLGWHDALYDTVASLLILREILAQLELGSLPLGSLEDLGVLSKPRS